MSFLALAIASVSACAPSVTLFQCGKKKEAHLDLVLSFKVHAASVKAVQRGGGGGGIVLPLDQGYGFSNSARGVLELKGWAVGIGAARVGR